MIACPSRLEWIQLRLCAERLEVDTIFCYHGIRQPHNDSVAGSGIRRTPLPHFSAKHRESPSVVRKLRPICVEREAVGVRGARFVIYQTTEDPTAKELVVFEPVSIRP